MLSCCVQDSQHVTQTEGQRFPKAIVGDAVWIQCEGNYVIAQGDFVILCNAPKVINHRCDV